MTLIHYAEVRCDGCGEHAGLEQGTRRARERAKQEEWVRKRSVEGLVVDLCPACARTYVREAESA